MIKMTYAYVQRNQEFGAAMRKLLTASVPQKVAYAAKKINDKLQSQRQAVVEDYRKNILEKFAQLDDKGEVKPDPDKPNAFLKREGTTEGDLDKAQEAFWEQEFTIERNKLKLSELAVINFTAMDLTALEPIYEDDSGEGEEA